MEIPVYQIVIDNEEQGAFAMSLVSLPATECSFQYFEKDKPLNFAIESEEKHLCTGVFMLADTKIYRRNEDGEYYVVFSKEVLRQIAQNFLRNGYNTNVDLQHDFNYIDGVYLQELFVKDVERGINPKAFENVPDGSLFCTYHIENEEVWQKVKDGTFTGYSLEGVFNVEQAFSDAEEKDYQEIVNLINEIKNKIK